MLRMVTTCLSRVLVLCLALAATGVQGQGYPNPYPRPGADKVTENDRVVVWHATWPPGVPTPMHLHRLDQVSVTVEGGTVRVTAPDGRVSSGEAAPGTVRFLRAGTIHQEEGTSVQVRRAYMVELKRPWDEKAVPAKPRVPPPTGVSSSSFAPGRAAMVLDNERVQVWDVAFARGMRWNTPLECCDTVRVAVQENGDPVGGSTTFLSAPAGEPFPPLDTSDGSARGVFVLLK